MPPPPFQREIRSARFPHGLPDRCDDTVVEAFDDAWLLLERTSSGYRVLGVVEDYESARAWLTAAEWETGSSSTEAGLSGGPVAPGGQGPPVA
ncbi:hypothetical protein [Modestobacter sp. I12A-02662]|uniref:hypothetical protein n=1 Tax=Modestobacter sp. I12A-02662 TaxID=1730496 RepID=UPI0034DF4E69